MNRLVVWAGLVFAAGCGGEPQKPSPAPAPAKSQPQPEPPKPRDEAKEATDDFSAYAKRQVVVFQDAVAHVEVTKKAGGRVNNDLDGSAEFTYKVATVKLRDTDVRKTDSLSTPIVGTMDVEVTWQLERVKGFPKDLVPESAKSPTKRVTVDCVWEARHWRLKSTADASAALAQLP